MTKKIKELTRDEQKLICKKHNCPECPLHMTVGCCWYEKSISKIKKELEKEITL